MDSSREWYYLDGNNQVAGPLTGDALRQLVAAGVITDQTLVAEAGTEKWVEYRHVIVTDSNIVSTPKDTPPMKAGTRDAPLKGYIRRRILNSPFAPWLILLLFFLVRSAGLKLGWISFGTPVISPACWVIAGLPIIFILAGHFFGSGGRPPKMPVLSSASCGLYGVVFLISLIVFIMPTWPRNLPGTWKSVVEPDTRIVFDAKGGYQEISAYPDGSGSSKAGRWTVEGGRLVLAPLEDLGKFSCKYDLTARGFAQSPDDDISSGWGYSQYPENDTAPSRSSTPAFARLKRDAKTWQTMLKEMMDEGFDPARCEAMVTERLVETRDGIRIQISDETGQMLVVLVELEFGDRALSVQSYNATGQWAERSKDAVPVGVNVFLPVNNISGGFKKPDFLSDGQLQVGLEPTKWEKELEALLDSLASLTSAAAKEQEALVYRIKEPETSVPGDTQGWGVYFLYADPSKATYVIFQNAYGLSENDQWSGYAASDAKRFAEVVDSGEYVFGAHEIHLWRHLLAGLPRYRELAREMLAKR